MGEVPGLRGWVGELTACDLKEICYYGKDMHDRGAKYHKEVRV